MKKENLLSEIAKFLEIDRCNLNDKYDLKGHSIDSLVVISIIAAVDIIYSVRVQGCEIDKCETVGDIFSLIDLKLKAL
ncbi:MAG: hypothetical protein A3E85_06055 [Gammaproteobacteria bacterium RIFCSPHIGHO2_12_FULL_45_12]|nr:MAG: hypothetical protein A3E85_06055 [Gammaproteobacteria bacterium RIFCSPHIGHO2_12_FULL_45_12]